jgi:hypothetical protein
MLPNRFEVKGNGGVIGGEGQISLGHLKNVGVACVHLPDFGLLFRGKVRANVDVVHGKGDDANGLVDVGVCPAAKIDFGHESFQVRAREREVRVKRAEG